MSIVKHLEQHLGSIQYGWGERSESQASVSRARIQVARFDGVLLDEAVTYATIGLSDIVKLMDDGREVRQELLFAAHARYPGSQIASFLLSFAEWVGKHEGALLRGQVIGPSTSLIPDVTANALYVSNPVIFPDGISSYTDTNPPTVIAWLIPLVAGEAERVRNEGWRKFEDTLETVGVDLLDLNRKSIFS